MTRCAWLSALALVGCTAQYDVAAAFDTESARLSAARVQVAVVSACELVDFEGPLGAAIRSVEFAVDEPAAPLGDLPAGTYGLYARAWDDNCQLVAAGCVEFEAVAGGEGMLRVEMAAQAGAVCAAAETCTDARCGGLDGGADAGMSDALPDGAGLAGSEADGGLCIDGEACADGAGICHGGACCEGCIEGEVCRVGEPPGMCELPPPPERLLFIGNSFLQGGPIPTMVHDLAVSAGFPEPEVLMRAVGGQDLRWHRMDVSADSAVAAVDEGWDVVLLQDFSTRPTVSAGDPMGFKEDALWFHDRALDANPECQVVLFETWARHPDHSIYPDTFLDANDMQSQLRASYVDAAEVYIPMNTAHLPRAVVSPVGGAWELHLISSDAIRLHNDDDYHANAAGRYLSALVTYSTIYGTRAEGLSTLGLNDADAELLQRAADSTTGMTRTPPIASPIPIDDPIRIDFGPLAADGWNFAAPPSGRSGPMQTESGQTRNVFVLTEGFGGVQEGGELMNDFAWPENVSRDSIWVGTSDGHDAALMLSAHATLQGLSDGEYRIELFGSRIGDDGGIGRLMRFEVDGTTLDLDAQDNQSTLVRFEGVRPSAGEIDVAVMVSPDGTARFGYLGAMVLTRTGD